VLLRKLPFQYVKKLPFTKPVPFTVILRAEGLAIKEGGVNPVMLMTFGPTLKFATGRNSS
jgi:hypothetical protein